MIQTVLDVEKKRDEEEGGTRRKEGQGGRIEKRGVEEGAMRRVKK